MLVYKDNKFSIELGEASTGEVESMMHAIVETLQVASGDKYTNLCSTDIYFMLELLRKMLPNEKQIDAYTERGFPENMPIQKAS
jgi:hypothetical protein